jgi:hypothetical protein
VMTPRCGLINRPPSVIESEAPHTGLMPLANAWTAHPPHGRGLGCILLEPMFGLPCMIKPIGQSVGGPWKD